MKTAFAFLSSRFPTSSEMSGQKEEKKSFWGDIKLIFFAFKELSLEQTKPPFWDHVWNGHLKKI